MTLETVIVPALLFVGCFGFFCGYMQAKINLDRKKGKQ